MCILLFPATLSRFFQAADWFVLFFPGRFALLRTLGLQQRLLVCKGEGYFKG
jgi:hypothetical protein